MTDATRPAAEPEPASPELVELAAAHGVATDFWDWQGRHTVVTRESIEAVLAALGVASHTEESVRASLADARLAPWRTTLPATVVVRSGWPTDVPVHLPHGRPCPGRPLGGAAVDRRRGGR
jgi:4-alpha-glucanotransferase